MLRRKFNFKKINMIIGKKQLIIVGLTLILGVAVYVNYLVGKNLPSETAVSEQEDQSAGNYGEEQFVSSNGTSAENAAKEEEAGSVGGDSADTYFAQARLDKEQSRAEAIEVLQSIYAGGDSTSNELAVIAQNVSDIGSFIESESKIENILKAQGFEDVLCYLSDNGASVIVKTDGLDSAQAAQIKSALLSETEIPAEKITILEIK